MTDPQSPHDTRAPAELLAATRACLGLSLENFARLLAEVGGPQLTRQRLSKLESSRQRIPTGLVRPIAGICATLDGVSTELRRAWRAVLANPEGVDPVPERTAASRRDGLAALVDRLDGNPRWPNYCRLAKARGVELNADLRELRRRLRLSEPQDAPWTPVNGDRVAVVEALSDLAIAAKQGALFVLSATLRNEGGAPWRDRLLIRVGPPVTSSLAFTPPVLSVPDTLPGAECRVAIPGRAPWFPNLTVVTYFMAFPSCGPCVSGSLQLFIDSGTEDGPAIHPLPARLVARLRAMRRGD